MTRTPRLMMIPLAVCTIALVGCGGDDESADATTTSEAAGDNGGDTDATPPTGVPDFASEECKELGEALDQTDLGTTLTSGDDPTEALDQAATTFENAAADGPEEVKDELETIATLYRELATRSAEIDWDAVRAGDPAAALSAGQLGTAFATDPDFGIAVQNLSEYANASCTVNG